MECVQVGGRRIVMGQLGHITLQTCKQRDECFVHGAHPYRVGLTLLQRESPQPSQDLALVSGPSFSLLDHNLSQHGTTDHRKPQALTSYRTRHGLGMASLGRVELIGCWDREPKKLRNDVSIG